jgi:hypothetical protein
MAWVCTNPDCAFNLKLRRGKLVIDEPVTGSTRCPRPPPAAPVEPPAPLSPVPTRTSTPAYQVGAPYDIVQTPYPRDEDSFTYRYGRFELALFFVNPRSAEVRDVRLGLARFALLIQDGVVVLLTSFGDSIDWSPTPFSRRFCEPSGDSQPQRECSDELNSLIVLLVDAGSRTIRAVRDVPLAAQTSERLWQGVREQTAAFREPEGYALAVSRLAERYPTETELVNHAAARWSDCGETEGKPWRR